MRGFAYSIIAGRRQVDNTDDFWSTTTTEIELTDAPGDKNLPSVTVSGVDYTPKKVIMMYKYWKITEDSGVANATSGAQVLSIDSDPARASPFTAIDIPASSWPIGANGELGGDITPGTYDVSSEVIGNGTYYPTWESGVAIGDGMQFHMVQTGLKFYPK